MKAKKLTLDILKGQIELMLELRRDDLRRIAALEALAGIHYSGSESDETSDFEATEDADDDSNDPPDTGG